MLYAIIVLFVFAAANTTVLLLFGIFVYRGCQVYPELSLPQMTTQILKALSTVVLFEGGKLILHHHIEMKNREV